MSRQKRKNKQHVRKNEQRTKDEVNRNHKDRLFRFLFRERKDLLELYNAVNQSDYQNPDELIITTLEDMIYVGMRNDVSFIIGAHMNLYEHQSTWNPNMPMRGLSYFARLYEAYIEERGKDVYGSGQVFLPYPSYVVFYNGEAEEPERKVLTLSDAFLQPERSPEMELPAIECRAVMLNINRGHNRELMKRCQRLWEYAEFIGEIRQNLKKGMALRQATDAAVEYCLEHEILTEVLSRCRVEVLELIWGEYGVRLHEECLEREARERGLKEGREQGILAMIELCQELGLSLKQTKEKIMEKFQLEEEIAEKYVK